MPLLPLENFITDRIEPKIGTTSKYFVYLTRDKFMTSTELIKKAPLPKIRDLNDKVLIKKVANELSSQIEKKYKIRNIDEGFFELLAICSNGEKYLLPTDKEAKNSVKKFKKNKK